ncbi:EF-hand domain-containing protein [Planotetraspora sp. A-T 1434]|uniref:EF-hand domain-containing protein n=1 Tax=Planotetraspora sp. A-T 1434 TaxID=2979219 RepID=UPI0021C18776|nr:EF-hand domain-containing protein [Planotetraspora sp. A-T 1434]MCT9931441.1 EF-hand domain-containing protein [Planotetraspora sp. A-T 1434]
MSEELPEERLAALKSEFEAIDRDGDGYITEAELVEYFPQLPPEAIGSLDLEGDVDGDGRFSLEEFIRLTAWE